MSAPSPKQYRSAGEVLMNLIGLALITVSIASLVFLVLEVFHALQSGREDRGNEQRFIPETEDFDARPAKGRFLVASRALADPRFQETVVLLLSYDARGAMGLIINRPTDVPVSEMLPDISWPEDRSSDVVYYGGPVEGERLFILVNTASRPKEATPVFNSVYVSTSRALLERLVGTPRKGERFRIYAGYAGWSAGQLDREIRRGDWHVQAADAETLFEKDAPDIWPILIRRGTAIQVWNMQDVIYAWSIDKVAKNYNHLRTQRNLF